ncbi:solute carrier organic anion transporter family member 2A1-like [Mizuhopecten yessoensis]|uniref:Solute carrier organic anion transporter family member n=1 Tax=Mizuhopecten yessoensis TaxID=6573 RepID=A0A210PZ38_MIZYE|nr:solute carrier organic anion transporter family member 2A1-like [Mizuhopecten yessoensis]OWF41742.1 Solute carrier organic anion transporter family member 2B1 [Mizuhopecten yessoensis]
MGDKPKSAKLASDTESGASADEEVLCGLYGLKISSLQCFANVQSFTFFYGLAGLMTQTLTFYVNSQVPNMEKQFGLSSAESGLLMSFNDIGFLLCSLFISSLARFVHIPRFLFYCTLLYGFSGIICSIPHYITPNIEDLYVTSGKTPDLALPNNITETESSIMPLCVPELQLENRNFTTCEDDNRKKIFKMVSPEFKALAIGIIAIGMMVQGIGKAPRAPFVTVYIDDNVEKRKTGFYIGIMSAAATMGPALAFGLGGYLSKIYVTLEDVPITPKDPRFIGAWWLGFLVFGLGSLLVAIPIILFPNRIKWNQKKVEEYRKDMPKEKPLLTTRAKVKDRVSSYWRIMKNPIYISILVTNCAMVCGQAGYISFLAKYIQTQFGTPLWQSNLILAVTKLVGLAIGAFVGGFLTRKIPMIPRNTFGLLLILFVVQNGTFIFGFFLGCDQPRVVGPESYHGIAALPLSNCSRGCNCDGEQFFSICGSDGVNYHSPCFAGCLKSLSGGGLYENCTCIGDGGTARAGMCDSDCKTLIPWSIFTFIGSVAGMAKAMLSFIAKIRCVEDRDKSTAMGIQSFFLSLLAFLPAPILFGLIIDTTCLIWMTGCSGGGACLFYDIEDFRNKIHLSSLMFYTVAAGSTTFAFIKTRKWKTWRPRGHNKEKTVLCMPS